MKTLGAILMIVLSSFLFSGCDDNDDLNVKSTDITGIWYVQVTEGYEGGVHQWVDALATQFTFNADGTGAYKILYGENIAEPITWTLRNETIEITFQDTHKEAYKVTETSDDYMRCTLYSNDSDYFLYYFSRKDFK